MIADYDKTVRRLLVGFHSSYPLREIGHILLDMPKDAKIVAASWDQQNDGFLLTLESESFPPVPAGNAYCPIGLSRLRKLIANNWREE